MEFEYIIVSDSGHIRNPEYGEHHPNYAMRIEPYICKTLEEAVKQSKWLEEVMWKPTGNPIGLAHYENYKAHIYKLIKSGDTND